MATTEITGVVGGVGAPQGFLAAGVACGIKRSKADLALVVSDKPGAMAAVLTTNRVQGHCVRLCKRRLANGVGQAIIINSGNANACTGPQGRIDAERMASAVAAELDLEEETVFVCSTGKIGVPLPIEKVEQGIPLAVAALSKSGGNAAAEAIMTTDTVSKQIAVEFMVDGMPVRIGGMAKGAGMIEPSMATMIGVLTTDAVIAPRLLYECLRCAVEDTFNRISVDGDQSTNDTVLCLANEMAGHTPLTEEHPDWAVFCAAMDKVCRHLAMAIVKDGEGATKFVTVQVDGAASAEDARRVVRAVGRSLLVKTAWFGGDPNWGRIIDAVGYSGAEITPDEINIRYDDVYAVRNGFADPESDEKDLAAVLKKDSFSVGIELNAGKASDVMYTCDCSEEYVRINSEYST